MNKKDVQKRVLQDGKPLALDKFEWYENAKVFSSAESHLVLDFTHVDSVTFMAGSHCVFKGRYNCIFKTGSSCLFEVSSECVLNTGSCCTIKTYNDCVIKTGNRCTLDIGSDCVLEIGSQCTVISGYSTSLDTGDDCIVIRRALNEVIELKEGAKIKLNGWDKDGYEIIGRDVEIIVDGKKTIISRKSAIALNLINYEQT